MTTQGLASKGEKGKSRFQHLDINNLIRESRGETITQHAAKSALPRKDGMQSLGKVPIARRPPNLPSLKAEASGGSDTIVASLVPSSGGTVGAANQGATWGKTTDSTNTTTATTVTTVTPTTPQNTSISPIKTPTGASGLTPHQAAVALPVTNTILTQKVQPNRGVGGPQSQTPTGTNVPLTENRNPIYSTQSHDNKSWSAVMTGSDLSGVGQPPPYQSAQFQHEFPSLSGSADTAENAAPVIVQRSGVDTQYGPGPSLRPQTEGSWMQGGCGAPGGVPEGGNLVQPGSVPVGHPMMQSPHPQFRGMVNFFMYKDNGGKPNAGPAGSPMNQITQQSGGNFHPGNPAIGVPTPGNQIIGGVTPSLSAGGPRSSLGNVRFTPGTAQPRGPPPPPTVDEIAQRPIIKEEELIRMDDMSRDAGWAIQEDIDYNQKLAFSDDETPSKDHHKDSVRQTSLPPKDSEKLNSLTDQQNIESKVQQSRGWSARNIPQSQDIRNVSQPINQPLANTSRRGVNEEYEVWSRRNKPDEARSAALAERAKQLKEEEEKREKEQRGAANKKLNELLDKKITEKKIDAKVSDETKGTINPAVVPRQPIIPVPIPVPGWEKDRENRERESDQSVRDIEQVRGSVPPTNEFRQFTMIEGRGIHRSDTKNSDRDIIRDRGERIDMRNERDRDREMREQRDNRMDNRKGPTYSTSFQLPPRFLRQQERHKSGGGSASPQLSNVSNPKPMNQPPPSSSPSNPSFAQQDESRWQPQNRRHRNDSDMEEDHRDIRRDRYTPDENRYRQHNVHRPYGDNNSRKSGSSTDAREFPKDNRDSREREIRDSRDRDRYYDDRNYRNQDYDYDKREHSDHDRKDRDRYDDRNMRSDEKNLSSSYDRDDRDRDNSRQDDYRDRRDFDRYGRDNVKDLERQRNDDGRRMHHQYDRDDRVRDHDRLNSRDVRDRDDHRYRDERPQRPDSRDSRTSRESRHSRDSMRELDTSREYSGSWADERAPFEEEKRKETYREERDRRVPGPITREKLEADELRNDKRNLQPLTLKRSTSGQSIDKKPEMKVIEEKKVPASDEDWNVNKKETTPIRELVDTASKAWADAISSSAIAPENVKPIETIEEPINQNVETSIKTETKEEISADMKLAKDDIKEKDDKRGHRPSGHNRGGRDNRNRWGSGYSVYNNRGGWNGPPGSGNNSGSGRRITPPSRMGSHRPPSSRSNDWKHTDSELSGDDISASNESVKEDIRIQRSPKPTRKLEKDEKNMEVKQEKNISSDRRFDKPRSYESSRPVSSNTREAPIVPRGEPSRWGRGNFRPSRGAGTGKRMDGYGPPPSKSPFSTQYTIDSSDKEKKDESELFSSDEKSKLKSNVSRSQSQTKPSPGQVPPRMQRKSDSESKRDRSNGRDNRSKMNKHSDEYAETPSENSDAESDRKDVNTTLPANQQTQRQNSNNSTVSNNSSNRSRSGSQSQLANNGRANSDKRPTSSNTYQGRSPNQSQPNRQNSSGNLRDKYPSSAAKPKEARTDDIKTDVKITNAISDLKISSPPYEEKHEEDYKNENLDSNIDEGSKHSNDLDGFQEVRSKKTVKPQQKDEKEKYLQPKKIEKETIITNRNQKPNGPNQMPHHTTNIPPLMATHISQPKNQFDRGRQKTIVAPRFLKQRENRIQKHMQQSMCDVNEMNKLNQNESMYSVKDSGGGSSMSQVNAWDKQVTTQLRTTIDVDSLNLGMDKCNEMDQLSSSSSQRNSPNTDKLVKCSQNADKSLLDGSTPPVNTLVFENKNYKSAPNITNDMAIKTKFNSHVKNAQRLDKTRTNKLDDSDIDNQTMLAFNKPINEIIDKKSDSIQLPLSFNKEDSSDMKLDFTFDADLSQLTDDKTGKTLGLPRSIHAMTISQSTISPAADLDLKIGSVKKLWEDKPSVLEHSGQEDGSVTLTSGFVPLDPSTAFAKPREPGEESHEVYSPSPSHSIQTGNSSTNVCKVKPTQQPVPGNPSIPAGVGPAQHHIPTNVGVPPNGTPGHLGPASITQNAANAGQQNASHIGPGHTLSPPPVQVMGMGQPPQAYTGGNQHMNYQPNLPGNAQYGSMSAIPSPPTVPFNITPHPSPGGLYGAFQLDQSRSQFSQFPPYGLGQTGTTPFNAAQSVYLQTAHPPPNAQPPPEVFSNLPSQYRMAATNPYGQSQQMNNNPNTVLITSTSNNSLMSPSVKPSSQQIGAIGTKAGAIGQSYGAQSQQAGVYLNYDPSLQPGSYMRSGPVQNNVVPGPIQSSNSYYSAGAGGQTGFYQQPGNPAQSLHQHQPSYGLQTNVFSGSVHSGSTGAAIQNFTNPLMPSPFITAAALQYRSQGNVSGLVNPGVGAPNTQQQQSNARPQQLKSPGGQSQQELFTVIANSVIQHQQQQQNNRQANINMPVSGRSQQQINAQGVPGAQNYPAPIQRPGSLQQPPAGMGGGNNSSQRGYRNAPPGNQPQQLNRVPQPVNPRPQPQYYGSNSSVTSSQEKSDEINKLNSNSNSANVNMANKNNNSSASSAVPLNETSKDAVTTSVREDTNAKNE